MSMSDSNIVDVDRYIDIRQDKEGKESAGNARGQRRGRLAKDGHTSPGKARRVRRASGRRDPEARGNLQARSVWHDMYSP